MAYTTVIFVVSLLVAASHASSCGLLPRRPPRVLMHPPDFRLVNACEDIRCTPPPNECYEESVCVDGQCLPWAFKPIGSPCDDGDDSTIGDSCSAGVCRGVSLTCPSDAEDRPRGTRDDSEIVSVSWDDAIVSGHVGSGVSVSVSTPKGSFFGVGTHIVSYAVSTSNSERLTCDFRVNVFKEADPCANVVCESGICHRRTPVCREEGVRAVCTGGSPFANGEYDKESIYRWHERNVPVERFESNFTQFSTVQCFDGKSRCEGVNRLQPKRPPRPPSRAPAGFQIPSVTHPTTTAVPTTRATIVTTTVAPRTTRAVATTTAFRGRGDDICTGDTAEQGGSCHCASNCYRCSWNHNTHSAGACQICTNRAYLHEGSCVSACPSGYAGVGTDNLFRECHRQRRRSLMSVDGQQIMANARPNSRTRSVDTDSLQTSMAIVDSLHQTIAIAMGTALIAIVFTLGVVLFVRRALVHSPADGLESRVEAVEKEAEQDFFELAAAGTEGLKRSRSMPELVIDLQ